MKFLNWAAAVKVGILILKHYAENQMLCEIKKFVLRARPKERVVLVAPYAAANSIQNSGKCPHGLPPGACPICSGMGGGGGIRRDKDKPRVAGEMSYNECMAAWIKIQAAKEAKIQAQIDKVEADIDSHIKDFSVISKEVSDHLIDKNNPHNITLD